MAPPSRKHSRARGAELIVTDRDVPTAQATVDRIVAAGGQARAVPLDVTDDDACARVAAEVHAAAGRLDVLVNNAGVGHVGTVLQTTGADLDRLYAVNVRGVFNVSKAFLPRMLERRAGAHRQHGLGRRRDRASRDRLAYCTTKFAVVGLTKSMALDHAAAGVRINCICPGRVETPFVAARLREYPDPGTRVPRDVVHAGRGPDGPSRRRSRRRRCSSPATRRSS